MKFIHLKAQIAVQEVQSKARRLLGEFRRFCERVGGNPKVKETEHSLILSCLFGRERRMWVGMWSWEDFMEMTVDGIPQRFDDIPKERDFSFGFSSLYACI